MRTPAVDVLRQSVPGLGGIRARRTGHLPLRKREHHSRVPRLLLPPGYRAVPAPASLPQPTGGRPTLRRGADATGRTAMRQSLAAQPPRPVIVRPGPSTGTGSEPTPGAGTLRAQRLDRRAPAPDPYSGKTAAVPRGLGAGAGRHHRTGERSRIAAGPARPTPPGPQARAATSPGDHRFRHPAHRPDAPRSASAERRDSRARTSACRPGAGALRGEQPDHRAVRLALLGRHLRAPARGLLPPVPERPGRSAQPRLPPAPA